MKHQPYEEWIFKQEDLDSDQAKELQVHLKLCDRCSELAVALSEVETQLASQAIIHPKDGFTTRWQERLERRKHVSFKRQTSVLFGGLSLGAAVLSVPVLIGLVVTLASSGNILSNFIQEFVEWFALISFTGGVTAGVIDGMVDTIPFYWWISLVFVVIGLFALWFFIINWIHRGQMVKNGVEVNGY